MITQEREPPGIEQAAPARDEVEVGVPAPAMDKPEQRQQLRPCAKSLVHTVGPGRGVVPQPIEQAAQGIVLLVDRVIGHEPPVLGIEHKHQAHQRRDQPAIEMLRIAPRQFGDISRALRIGRNEAAQQLMQRGEHLPRQPGGNLRLRFPAPVQQGRKAGLRGGAAEQAIGREQHVERGQDRAPRRLGHLGKLEGHMAGRLPPRCMEQPNSLICTQQADRNTGFAQQALETGVQGCVPAIRRQWGPVEIGPGNLLADQHHPPGFGATG